MSWLYCLGAWVAFALFFCFVWWPKIVGPRSDKDE